MFSGIRESTKFKEGKSVSSRHLLSTKKTMRHLIKNDDCVYITSDDFVFDRKAYRPEILKKYISKDEFDTIISELNKLVTKSFMENNKHEKFRIYRFIFVLLFIDIILFCVGSFCVFKAEDFNKHHKGELNLTYVLSFIFFLTSLGILLGITIHNYKHTNIEMDSIEETIHSYIKQYVSFLNVFYQGVCHFNYFPNHTCIEICVVAFEDGEEGGKGAVTDNVNKEIKKMRRNDVIRKLENIFSVKDETDALISRRLYDDGIFDESDEEEDKNDENSIKKEEISFIDQNKDDELTRDKIMMITEHDNNNTIKENTKMNTKANSDEEDPMKEFYHFRSVSFS